MTRKVFGVTASTLLAPTVATGTASAQTGSTVWTISEV